MRILLLGLVIVPHAQSLSAGARAAQELRPSLTALASPDTQLQVRVTHDAARQVRELIAKEDVELVAASATSNFANEFLRVLECDVVLLKGALPQKIKHILLPIRGGPFAALALECALAFTPTTAADITLLHATPPTRFREPSVRALFQHLRTLPKIKKWIRARGDAAETILEYAQPRKHQLVVMGAAARVRNNASVIGPVAARVLEQSKIPVLIVKTARGLPERAPVDEHLAPVEFAVRAARRFDCVD